jgi:hypothetical protein
MPVDQQLAQLSHLALPLPLTPLCGIDLESDLYALWTLLY